MKFGRSLASAVVGLFFMFFVALDLVLFGVVPLDSVVVTILLVLGLVGGALLGWFAAGRARPAVPPSAAP